MHWYLEVLRKYAVFSGRARRKEYWYFFLFNVIISIVLTIVDVSIGSADQGVGVLGAIYSLLVLIPGLAVSVRRLHDTNRSGFWLLIAFIPFIGVIILLIFLLQDSDAGENQYGPNPKAAYA